MNKLQFFACISHTDGREYWCEIVTMRAGEREARRSVFSLNRARQMADALCDRYGVTDRAGLHCGAIIRV